MSIGQGIRDEQLINVAIAQKVNSVIGGALVGPWDIGIMDPDLIDILIAVADELPSIERGRAQIKKKIGDWKANHPTYRKHKVN